MKRKDDTTSHLDPVIWRIWERKQPPPRRGKFQLEQENEGNSQGSVRGYRGLDWRLIDAWQKVPVLSGDGAEGEEIVTEKGMFRAIRRLDARGWERAWSPWFLLVTDMNRNIKLDVPKQTVLVRSGIQEGWWEYMEFGSYPSPLTGGEWSLYKGNFAPNMQASSFWCNWGTKGGVILHWTHRKSLDPWWWLLVQPIQEIFFQWWVQPLKPAACISQLQLVRG